MFRNVVATGSVRFGISWTSLVSTTIASFVVFLICPIVLFFFGLTVFTSGVHHLFLVGIAVPPLLLPLQCRPPRHPPGSFSSTVFFSSVYLAEHLAVRGHCSWSTWLRLPELSWTQAGGAAMAVSWLCWGRSDGAGGHVGRAILPGGR